MSADGYYCTTAWISATTPLMPVRSATPKAAQSVLRQALSATALYAVTFRPNADGRIATVQLRWEDPDTHQVTEIGTATSIPGIWQPASRGRSPLPTGRGRRPIRRDAAPQPLGSRDICFAVGRARLPAVVHLVG